MNKMIIFRERRPRPGRLGRWDFCGLGIGFLLLGSLSVPAKAQTFEVGTSFTIPASLPAAGLVQGTDGLFYGTTRGGGALAGGTVFKIDSAGNLTTLHTFSYPNGLDPEAGLVLASDGKFYGTARVGGAY